MKQQLPDYHVFRRLPLDDFQAYLLVDYFSSFAETQVTRLLYCHLMPLSVFSLFFRSNKLDNITNPYLLGLDLIFAF
jgi:hypothetical protein